MLRRVLLPCISLAAGAAVQFAVAGPDGSRELPLFLSYALAIVVFAWAVGGAPLAAFASTVHDTNGSAIDRGPRSDRLSPLARALLAIAVVSAVIAATQFTDPATYSRAWIAHLIALASFIAAFLFPLPLRRSLQTTIGDVLPIAVVLILAAFARLWQLQDFPFGTWIDEASNGIAANQILHDPAYRPIYVPSSQMPAHFHYLLALSFLVFGPNTGSIRIVTALFGIISVLLTYLLFRRWFGTRLGLVAACLLAVMRYHLTVSRFGMQAITTPAFELAFLYFLDRALAYRRRRDFAWMGLTLGFGMAFYYALRLFPLVLGLFAVLLTFTTVRARMRNASDHGGWAQAVGTLLRPLVPHVAAFALGFAITTAPIAQFALQEPADFFQRTSTVSIFQERDEPNLAKALWKNVSKHARMYNLRGDFNGRHNIPGEPMLDPLTATLFVFGLALALRRWRDPANRLMLLLLVVMNLAGILSLDYEAPQSLRSIGVIPALIYFSILPLAAIAVGIRSATKESTGTVGPVTTPYAVALMLLLGAVAYLNFQRFFVVQKHSPDTWFSYSTTETIAAREMSRLAPTHDLLVSPFFYRHPTVEFLAPEVTAAERWTLNDRFPIPATGNKGAALVFDPTLVDAFNQARSFYPNAVFREIRPPFDGAPLLYEAELSVPDLRSLQGVLARFFPDQNFGGTPLKQDVVPRIAGRFDRPFAAEYIGTLHVAHYGAYRFEVRGPAIASLRIDGEPVSADALTLAIGNHDLRLQVAGEPGEVELWWQTPDAAEMEPVPESVLFRPIVASSGLMGSYFPTSDWSGAPAFTRNDPQIAFYFQDLPLPRPYSIEWRGKIFVPQPGTYRLGTDSIDESMLTIDGRMLVNNATGTPVDAAVFLERGWHDIVLRFKDWTSHSRVSLYWTPPDGARAVVPSAYLSPPRATYPSSEQMARILAGETDVDVFEQAAPTPTISPGPREGDVAPFSLVHVATFGERGTAPGQFREPRAVVASADGRVFVADSGNQRVQIFDNNGTFIKSIDGADVALSEPFDLALAVNGELLVLDSALSWVYRFDGDGVLRGRLGGPAAQFYNPRGVATDVNNSVYVADTGGERIVKMAIDGEALQIIGMTGSGRERLSQPSDVVVAGDGSMFVTDVQQPRIAWLKQDGQFIHDFPLPAATSLDGPRVALAADGTLLVTAPGQHRVQRYTPNGTLIADWGEPGDAAGQFQVPTGISVQGDTVWVADTGNNRVQKWAIQR